MVGVVFRRIQFEGRPESGLKRSQKLLMKEAKQGAAEHCESRLDSLSTEIFTGCV
jgi:hypothetical protein